MPATEYTDERQRANVAAVQALLERRAAGYREIISTRGWADVLQEMLAYASREPDPHVRCGRLDMVAHMIRCADTAGNVITQPEVVHAA